MINKLATIIADRLVSIGTIKADEKELYVYGLFMLISKLMYFFIAFIVGIVFGVWIESIVFFVSFMAVRKYGGGYHADSETKCEILSILSIIICIIAIRVTYLFDMRWMLLVLSVVSAVIVFVVCPLDTPDKPLNDKEFKHYRKITRIIVLGMLSVVIVSFYLKTNMLFAPCCAGLILEGVLSALGKIRKQA